MDSLAANTKNRESTRSWPTRVRFPHPWAVWMSHVTHMNESRHTYEWVIPHTYESVMSLIRCRQHRTTSPRGGGPCPTSSSSTRTRAHGNAFRKHHVPSSRKRHVPSSRKCHVPSCISGVPWQKVPCWVRSGSRAVTVWMKCGCRPRFMWLFSRRQGLRRAR